MWPASMWKRYEHVIRHAAGLGKAADKHRDPDRYEKIHAHCEVLIAGGGASGLFAALQAAIGGSRVIVADEQSEFGGWLLCEQNIKIDGHTAEDWIKRILSTKRHPNVPYLPVLL